MFTVGAFIAVDGTKECMREECVHGTDEENQNIHTVFRVEVALQEVHLCVTNETHVTNICLP